ncbi:MAG: efflux RND transporter periplasmic adaptor subunit [Chitinophagales bacterium]|nr:efflux RND transporter periplasmic adaptor subunit [Chitinophagales bacterium]
MKLLRFILLMLLPFSVFAHEGEPHGEEAPATAPSTQYFSTEAISDKYELLLKYEHLHPGETSVLRLFVSEYATNRAIDSASIQVTSPELPGNKYAVRRLDKGIYEIKGIFPAAKAYSFNVNINSSLGPDLIQLKGIEAGKELPHDEEVADEKAGIAGIWLGVIGLVAGLLIMFLIMRFSQRKVNKQFVFFFMLMLFIPLNHLQVNAHGGEDHAHDDAGGSGTGSFSTQFTIPKETQFLFNVITEQMRTGNVAGSVKLNGTIIPSSNGQALIQTPQTGKIISLSVRVGQQVQKGQVLAVVEQNLDAATQVNLLTERNNVEAEYEAAKKNYERLKSIQDIAAKKDVAEAEARYQKALANKKLLDNVLSGSSGSSKITLRSPIAGIVGNFSFAVGSTVNAGEDIFSITNLDKVYVEARVFSKDAAGMQSGGKYMVESTTDPQKKAEVKLLSKAQTIDPTNQTQLVLFEMTNPAGAFKIGEFVNVRVFSDEPTRDLAVPNSAISELNGKPIVFIKDQAERYSISYITAGDNNGNVTVIETGVEEGERVVTNATYQVKMIYLNQ